MTRRVLIQAVIHHLHRLVQEEPSLFLSSSSSGSSSSNSITDFNIGIGGYYQHPGYLHNDDDEERSTEFETDLTGEGGRNRNNYYDDYDTKPNTQYLLTLITLKIAIK